MQSLFGGIIQIFFSYTEINGKHCSAERLVFQFMQKRRFWFIILTLTACLSCLGCQASPPDPFGFLVSDFSAELEGVMEKTQFCAAITVENCDSGRHCRLVYSAPESLDGVAIELFCAPDGMPIGTATVTSPLGVTYTVSVVSIEGLCRPLLSLLNTCEIASLQKTDEGFLFVTTNGSERITTPSGVPLSFNSPSICWTVLWFQGE